MPAEPLKCQMMACDADVVPGTVCCFIHSPHYPKDFGGPAFPVANLSDVAPQGMDLRDWFASQVAPEMLSATVAIAIESAKLSGDPTAFLALTDAGFYAAVVKDTYRFADAMLLGRGGHL